ncbi:molecular chaperone DnaJ [Lacticaseibacillus paracasei]|uniref:molecular chaperone DnaJ n=1 Tax=Lacticaseibacillus paracasei TaxID=1597 RepID=UPI000A3AC4A0|nr:molecular chaperone DnaJ [Lacticaseibacillus paracasei]OUC68107.1 Chaperone protein DnaJ [Lacticaseibacillus paracasei]
MADQKDYYETLGVSRDADDDTIRKAFRKLSKKYHPDLNHAPGAEQKFKDINEAYQVLSDPQKRAAYDQYGSADGPQGFGGAGAGQGGFSDFGGGQGGFGGFDDIFSQFFGGAGGGAQANPSAPRQGADLQYRMDLTFEEAIFGKDTKISYDREAVCHTCNGSGAKPGTSPVTCHKCHGSGYIQVQRNTAFGAMMTRQVCDVCGGTGKEIKEKCPTCHGTGHEQERHTIDVKVPAGVEDGQQMRLQQAGEAGTNGGPYGDLYIVFRVAPSKKYQRDGSEIYLTIPLSFAQAALGDEIKVDTVHGAVELKIPAGTQSQTKFRLRGKGAPRLRGNGTGDQIVTVEVQTPKYLNEKQKSALMQFAAASGEDVTPHNGTLFDRVKEAFKGGK